MFPICLILGDSTALGTASALAASGMRCEVHARVGASSAETLRSWVGGARTPFVLIASGSNDPNNPALATNLTALRRRTSAVKVTWLAPYDATAARVVSAVANAFGDRVISLAYQPTRDRIHPVSYRSVALSLGWGIGPIGELASVVAPVITRQAKMARVASTRTATVIVFR